jgi:A/G-specific adenine glycosylase
VAFRRSLLRWYDLNRRDLPWRKTRDPYRIWISEIMLQQTRVAAVLEHYRLFLRRFPNIRALARAPESAVLAAWSGLGYYRRARMMRLCAQHIVQEHKGRFPRTSGELRSLPGIGRYTAAAIASIAFGSPIAVVDGNVERVLERLSGEKLLMKDHWQRAQELLTTACPGDHNQAMMELGATVCTPRRPTCTSCPIRKWCATKGEIRAIGSMERRPPAPGRANESPMPLSLAGTQTKKELWCTLAQHDGHIRLVQRPQDASLMAAMWELPQSPKASRPASPPWRTFRHSITTTDYTVHVIRQPAGKGKWVPAANLPQMPITGLTRKILKAAGII